MFELTRPSEGMKLLQWSKELPSASDTDPLGLNLRVSARLSNELLYCITSITPRARYYSFFPWAFQNYNEQERGKTGDRGRVQGVLLRERAMVLGAVLHHGGEPCDGGALGGSDKAVTLARRNLRSYDLAGWRHLEDKEGQFGAAYKGSLINLGIFQSDADEVADEVDADRAELNEETQEIEVGELSSLGKRLADAFGSSVKDTSYVGQKLFLKNRIKVEALAEFGSRAGLCEINSKRAADRNVLRKVFFARYPEITRGGHLRRRMSLLLLLECIDQAHKAGIVFDDDNFNDACYFGSVLSGGDTPKRTTIRIPPPLRDIHERWRIFYCQNYLTVALQAMLVACVRAIRERPGGMMQEHLVQALNSPGLSARVHQCFDDDLPKDFFALTAAETLEFCGVESRNGAFKSLPIDAPCSERSLELLLVETEANEAVCLPLAGMLLYQLLVRYNGQVRAPYQNWYRQHVHDDLADVSLPGIAHFLKGEFGESWVNCPNVECQSHTLPLRYPPARTDGLRTRLRRERTSVSCRQLPGDRVNPC